jgi:hypothetical protein
VGHFMDSNPASLPSRSGSNALWVLLLMLGILAGFFWRSLLPSQVIFSNDGPVAATSMDCLSFPGAYSGFWRDLNWLGENAGSVPIEFNSLIQWALGPIGHAKAMLPMSVLFLALSAWLFFRRAGLGRTACVFGAVAASLNSSFFSDGCWGLVGHLITAGMNFLALAALTGRRGPYWIRLALAGLAVGVGVIESADIGALYSLVVAAWVVYQAWAEGEGGAVRRLLSGSWRVGVVALCAGVIACQTILSLVSTQIVGVAGAEQTAQNKAEKWDWATQWSLPKKEALGLAAPGLFGYRMDTLEGGQYWGQIGQTPGWEEHHQGFPRYSGTGYYAGILVILLSLWAALNVARRGASVFSQVERRWIWFWAVLFGACLLLAFGRHAPFYQFVYALPFFSTIRNPTKFLFLASWALAVLSAFGIEGLFRSGASAGGPARKAGNGPTRAPRTFRELWQACSLVLGGAGLIGWLIYSRSAPALERFLQTEGFGPADAGMIAGYSIGQAGWALLFLLLSLALVLLVMRAGPGGAVRKWGGVWLLGFLILDLGRANLPWVVYWDYQYKYASNPVIEFLRNRPYEHRVAALPFRPPSSELSLLSQMYAIEWAQQHFYFYNIQALDIVQMSREPVVYKEFEGALRFDGSAEALPRITRRWQLTNTRYLLGASGFLELLNSQLDPVQKRFRPALRFNLVPKAGVSGPSQLQDFTAVVNTNGDYAVFEFTGALPRVKLYANWEVSTNDQATLARLATPSFDPAETVLVAQPLPGAPGTNRNAGTVEFSSYAPTRIVLKADAKARCVLLLNDRHDPDWKVTVDGQPAPLLRCNYIMRGVELAPGQHTVEFAFRPPTKGMYVAIVAMGFGVLLVGALLVCLRLEDRRPG